MAVQNNMVVSMNYTLKDREGTVIDASEGTPLDYIQGQQNIIPGLEKELEGLNIGDKKQVQVTPEEGYGQYRHDLKFTVPKEQFDAEKPEVGMMIQLQANSGETFIANVVDVSGEEVMLDANHPLAGKDLFFDVEIVKVREATEEELAHGHAHGEGGHHH